MSGQGLHIYQHLGIMKGGNFNPTQPKIGLTMPSQIPTDLHTSVIPF